MEQIKRFLYSKGVNNKLEKLFLKKKILLIGPAPYLEDGKYNLLEMIDQYDLIVRIKSSYPIPSELKKIIGDRIDIYYTNLKEEQNNLNENTFRKFYRDKIKAIIFPYPSNYQITIPINHQERNLLEILKKNYQKKRQELLISNNLIQKKYKIENLLEIYSDQNPFYFLNLIKIMGTRPTTGLLAILDILQYPIKELKIVGFTFRHHLIQTQKSGLIPSNDELKESYSEYYKNKEARDRSWNKTIVDVTHDLEKELNFFKLLKTIDPRIRIDNILEEIISSNLI